LEDIGRRAEEDTSDGEVSEDEEYMSSEVPVFVALHFQYPLSLSYPHQIVLTLARAMLLCYLFDIHLGD
jgi:hypothetical protein